VGELRDKAAWTLLRSTAADNPTISTGHGDGPEGGFKALCLMVKTTDEGRTLGNADIYRMLNRAFDVVIFCDAFEGQYSAADIWFRAVDKPLCISEEALAA
jgi:type IV secretory pathway ATPase VirB11/archaellum biosynthesis ATPase